MGTHTSLKRTQYKEVQTGAGAAMGGKRAQISERRQWSVLCLWTIISFLLKYGCIGLGCFNDFCTVITKIMGVVKKSYIKALAYWKKIGILFFPACHSLINCDCFSSRFSVKSFPSSASLSQTLITQTLLLDVILLLLVESIFSPQSETVNAV